MIVLHDEACERFAGFQACNCAAPTAEQLRELVENATAALRFMKDFDKFGPNFGHGISSIRLETMVVDLAATLKPFRKGGEKK